MKNKQFLFVAAALFVTMMLPAVASATQLNQAGIRLGRLGISASANNDVLVTFKLNTTPTSVAKISVFFPTGYTLTAGTPTPSVATYPLTPASITAPPGTLTSVVTSSGAGAGGTIVVSGLTSASLTNSALYGFTIPTGSVANPASAGPYATTVASQDSGGTPIDTTSTPTYIYGATSDDDQVTVSASVAPNFSFSLSANTDTVPEVDPSAAKTSTGVTMTVGTNSPLGYTAYVRSANAALTSATSPSTPISTGTFGGGPDTMTGTNYGLVPATGTACVSCSGSLAYDTEYNVVSGTTAGAFNGTAFASFVSRNGYTDSDQISLKERVSVANTVAYANDYTDTLTIVAAGNF